MVSDKSGVGVSPLGMLQAMRVITKSTSNDNLDFLFNIVLSFFLMICQNLGKGQEDKRAH